MNVLDAVSRVLTVIKMVSEWAALAAMPLFIAATVYRRATLRPPATRRARVDAAVVLALLVVGAAAALISRVSSHVSWELVGVAVLVVVLVGFDAGNERFWSAASSLLIVYAVIGGLILYGLSYSFRGVDSEALWYGGRQLIAWGGQDVNPTHDGWWIGALGLNLLAFALPLTLTTTCAWWLHDKAMPSWERALLKLSVAIFASHVLFGAFFMAITFVGGVYAIPLAVAVSAGLGALLILATFGPGAVDGLLFNGRTVGARIDDRISLHDDTGFGAREFDESSSKAPVAVSLARFMRGNFGRPQKIYLTLVALFVVLLVAGDAREAAGTMERVHFEEIHDEINVGFVVDQVLAGPETTAWLLGVDGQLAAFNVPESRVNVVGTQIAHAAAAGDVLLAVRSDSPNTMLRFDPADATSAPQEVWTSTSPIEVIATDGRQAVASTSDGSLISINLADGAVGAVIEGTPTTGIGITDDAVWSAHPAQDAAALIGTSFVVQRDRTTLEPLNEEMLLAESLVAIGGEAVWFEGSLGVGGVGSAGKPLRISGLPDFDDNVALLGSVNPESLWVASEFGRVYPTADGQAGEPVDFPYDSIVGMIGAEIPGEWWVVASNDRGMVVDTNDVRNSVLARWRPAVP